MNLQILSVSRASLCGCALAFSLFSALCSTPLLAFDKPPLSPDQAAPEVTPSRVSAIVRFSAGALARDLDREVPRRIATFNDRLAGCGHRRFLRRQINVECVYSGYVERTAPISLRAEGDRLSAAVPVRGFVAGQGARGFSRLLHGTAEGRMTVYALARPQLTSDWSVALHLDEDFRWTEPPVLRIFGFQIGIARFVEPKIRSEMRRVEAKVIEKIRALDLRSRADAAWQRAFAPVKIADNPEIWLQMMPQSVAYTGIRGHADALEGAIEIVGSMETQVGAAPPPRAPAPLPPPGTDVADPGHFDFLVPISIGYQVIRQALQQVLAASDTTKSLVSDVDIYPSAGKIVVGLRLNEPQGAGADSGGWIYLSVRPQIDNENKVVSLGDVTVLSDPGGAGETLGKLVAALQRQLSVSYKAAYEKILTTAGTKLSRDLGNGFKSEGTVTTASVENVALLAGGLRVTLRASGELKIVFTP